MLAIVLILLMVLYPGLSWSKDNQQDQIILLNDSASALEDSNPELSKKLTQLANEQEKEWEASNANKNAASPTVDKKKLKQETEIVKQAAKAIGPTYPLITKALLKMAKDINETANDTKK